MKKWTKLGLLFFLVLSMSFNVHAEEAAEEDTVVEDTVSDEETTEDDVTEDDVTEDDVTEGEDVTEEEPVEEVLAAPVLQAKQTAGGIRLSWTSAPGATKYEVYRICGEEEWAETPWYTTKKCYVLNTSITYANTYSYKVKAVKEDTDTRVESEFSEVVSRKVKLVQPENFQVNGNTYTSLKLTWNKSNPATGYMIYRSTSEDGKYKLIKTISKKSTVSYVDSDLTLGTTYYYKIRAIHGDKKGTYSSVASKKVMLDTPVMKTTSYVTASSVQARWKQTDGAQGYYVYRKIGTGSWKKIGTVTSGKTLSYTDKTATGEARYAVKAYRKVNGKTYTSNRANGVYARTLTAPTVKISQVDGQKKATLKWNAVKNATKYRIYKKTGSSGSWKFVKAVSSDVLKYTAEIPTGKTIYWKVRATNTINENYSYGAYSAVKSVTICLPRFITYLDMETSALPTKKKTEGILMGVVNVGNAKMRIYSKDAYLRDGSKTSYNRNLVLGDIDTETEVDYIDVAIMKGELDDSDIGLPLFLVNGNATRFNENSQIEFVFRYDGLYYKAYVKYDNVDIEEIEKP